MRRAVVNVASTEFYRRGQSRLTAALASANYGGSLLTWPNIPNDWPSHESIQYGFKACALHDAAANGFKQLLWCDACIVPLRSLDPIWAWAAVHGVWIGCNYGFSNYEWTADSAYADLFPPLYDIDTARAVQRIIPHVIATAFALDLRHPDGRAFLSEYHRLATQTRAFCGPWINAAHESYRGEPAPRAALCGPSDVRGHRHDQTAASVIAWRLGIPLTDPPKFFAYRGGETEETILMADGGY